MTDETPKPSLRDAIGQAGIDAGLEAARAQAENELHVQATTVDHGTVKLSVSTRWKFLKAAVWGSYSKDKGGAAGVDGVIKLGKD